MRWTALLATAISMPTCAAKPRLPAKLQVNAAIDALRTVVERCFKKIKTARRLATCYDKTAKSYLGFIHIVSIQL